MLLPLPWLLMPLSLLLLLLLLLLESVSQLSPQRLSTTYA